MSTEIENKFKLPVRFRKEQKSVWIEYIQLGIDYDPINLAFGFCDYHPPEYVRNALAEVSKNDDYLIHQYARPFGLERLVKALATLYSQLIGREINPMKEILTTLGGFEALYCCVTGHVDVGDEVIIIEPFFDCYAPLVKAAGGVCRFIPLRLKDTNAPTLSSSDWYLDKEELEGLFNEKTKVLMLTNPNNPIGKVFDYEELEFIANLCKKWNVLCISDEVYEWIVFKPKKHIRMATLPGMWERTLTIGSAGKTFSVTGWKVGWVYGPANLIMNPALVHIQNLHTNNTPLQEAVAICFETELGRLNQPECYLNSVSEELQAKRDLIAKSLVEVGMRPIVPDGGYFLISDFAPLENRIDLSKETDKYHDYKFSKWLVKNVNVLSMPLSAFCCQEDKHLAENFIRFCFFKTDEKLEAAAKALKEIKKFEK